MWLGIRWINEWRSNMVCQSNMDWSGDGWKECERRGLRRHSMPPRHSTYQLDDCKMFAMEAMDATHAMERGIQPKMPMLEAPREPSAPAREAREARDPRRGDSAAPRRASFTPYMG